MLARRHRLRRRSDFASTLRRGPHARRVGRPNLVVHLSAPPRPAGQGIPDEPRVGFAVSKAVGGVVLRNRVKRRLRALVAARLPCLPPGAQVVVRALPPAAAASSAELAADLDAALAAVAERRR